MIGRRHAEAVQLSPAATLCAIVDPTDEGKAFASSLGVRWHPDLAALFAAGEVDGVVLAVPNTVHGVTAMQCVEAGIPAIVEKPFTTDLVEGRRVLAAAKAAGLPLLTGHHRRYNPLIRKAVEIVRSGKLGHITTVQAQTCFLKPDHYFDVDWRRKAGAGPVYLNLIHDIDLLNALCGPITSVHAMESNAVRGNEVEETAVVLLKFESGVLGTVNVSDTASAPWSWELTARENAHYPATSENCYWLGGTKGSLALPNLAVWTHDGPNGWWSPISASKPIFEFDDPLVLQVSHFSEVIAGTAEPVVSGADGLAAVEVITAIKRSAATGKTVEIANL
ncbi:Gfo/Idh/MocA family protein [Marivivens donghaensis]|uniref:Gfo/Idh/MocA family protein n=1 Tax=Marivivens donghaensis TaxID=1699413 RepID=UPI00201E76D9|nr:Gfo/Idh/MocA family oxidoreductase [Marivivens donghaensis]MCL7409609.1 Gfo/Idh/MocA family oxidoreductase [Marivivens donghaensis]MDN3705044.1 Gfo/Idh/MocA family oxidoreductase [Marivivens donghaensis]